ncbi:MAG: histidine--tRNA ligase [Candidatus Micrarchaeota archaeon]
MELRTPRGMRDFMPAQMNARNAVISVVERVFRRYGYEPLETPALENMEILDVKCGEDTNKQIYRVEDGKLGMRFDLTVPLARVVASNQSLPKPFKRYCIGKVWRREEPQKGRFREFLQADVDIIGSSKMECDAELLACASECLKKLGFKDFRIRVNNRKILDSIITGVGITAASAAVFRTLDKLEKIGEKGVNDELVEMGVGKDSVKKLMEIISQKGDNEEILKNVGGYGENGIRELEELVALCNTYCLENVSVDLSLVRGLDYYTGPVFEISAGGGVGSIAGGGRYDNLIGVYSGVDVPAVGISLGIERIMALLGEGDEKSCVEICIAAVKPEFYPNAIAVAQELRASGMNVQVDLMGRNLRKQFDYANSKKIMFIGVIGQREAEKDMITVRNLETGEEKVVSPKEVRKIVWGE